jgi:trimeric autotransporter adhesin
MSKWKKHGMGSTCGRLVATLALAGALQAGGAVLYETDFNAPTYADGPLNTNTDTTTAGQAGWLNTSGGGTNNIPVSNAATNGRVSLTTSGQDVRHPFDSGQTVTSGSVFLEADIVVSAAQATGDYALHFTDGGTSNFYGRTYIRSSGGGFQMALGTSSGTAVTYGTTVLNLNQPYHVLVRYDMVPGTGNDTGALYIDPVSEDGSLDTPYVAATTIGTDATTIAAVALRQGAAGNSATLTVDNLGAFSAVVPEPGALGLIGLAAVFGLRRRRRA